VSVRRVPSRADDHVLPAIAMSRAWLAKNYFPVGPVTSGTGHDRFNFTVTLMIDNLTPHHSASTAPQTSS
jgi:hypothetical protein